MNAAIRPTGIDYQPCKYGSSRMLFRGPARRIMGDYVAFLGGSETFGRFLPTPYPDLVEQRSGLTAINLGCMSTGIDAYVGSPGLIDICSMAKVTVIQLVGAVNMSNRFYTVDPRHNDHFLRASKRFKEAYPEVDFTKYDLTSHMLTDIARIGPDRLHLIRQEMQSAWVARMRSLLKLIDGKKILLWMSDHAPHCAQTPGTICREPLFVDRAMLNAIRTDADALIEIIAEPGEVETGRAKLVYPPSDQSAAAEALGPLVHERAALHLDDAIAKVLDLRRPASLPPAQSQALPPAQPEIDLMDDPIDNLFAV